MKARDVMVTPVVTVRSDASIRDVATLFLEKRISGAPVVDDGVLVGIVSEGDLLHRVEAGTLKRLPWWLKVVAGGESLAADYVKSHSKVVRDVMTPRVITAKPETPLHEIASLLEKNAIKRVPIVENGSLVGIVSRANLIQAIAHPTATLSIPQSDSALRDRIMRHLNEQQWANTTLVNVTVRDGVADLWGIVDSETERAAMRVAAGSVAGVRAVNDHLQVYHLAHYV